MDKITETHIHLAQAAEEYLKYMAQRPMATQGQNLSHGDKQAWDEAGRGVNMALRVAVAASKEALGIKEGLQPDALFADIPMADAMDYIANNTVPPKGLRG